MTPALRSRVAVLALVVATGCSTLVTLAVPMEDLHGKPFAGTAVAAGTLADPGEWYLVPLILIDLPLSLAADVAMLPGTLIYTIADPWPVERSHVPDPPDPDPPHSAESEGSSDASAAEPE